MVKLRSTLLFRAHKKRQHVVTEMQSPQRHGGHKVFTEIYDLCETQWALWLCGEKTYTILIHHDSTIFFHHKDTEEQRYTELFEKVT